MSLLSRLRGLFRHTCAPDSFTYKEDGVTYAVCQKCFRPIEVPDGSEVHARLIEKVAKAVASHPTYIEGKKQKFTEPKRQPKQPKSPNIVKMERRRRDA